MLEDGTRQYADLIITAYGVHSTLRAKVLRDQGLAQTTPSGMSSFRFIIPTAALQDDLRFQELLPLRGKGCCLFADATRETEHHMVWFTAREYVSLPLPLLSP